MMLAWPNSGAISKIEKRITVGMSLQVRRSVHFNRMHGDFTTCMETHGSGVVIGMRIMR